MDEMWTERNIPKPAMRSTMQKLRTNIGEFNLKRMEISFLLDLLAKSIVYLSFHQRFRRFIG